MTDSSSPPYLCFNVLDLKSEVPAHVDPVAFAKFLDGMAEESKAINNRKTQRAALMIFGYFVAFAFGWWMGMAGMYSLTVMLVVLPLFMFVDYIACFARRPSQVQDLQALCDEFQETFPGYALECSHELFHPGLLKGQQRSGHYVYFYPHPSPEVDVIPGVIVARNGYLRTEINRSTFSVQPSLPEYDYLPEGFLANAAEISLQDWQEFWSGIDSVVAKTVWVTRGLMLSLAVYFVWSVFIQQSLITDDENLTVYWIGFAVVMSFLVLGFVCLYTLRSMDEEFVAWTEKLRNKLGFHVEYRKESIHSFWGGTRRLIYIFPNQSEGLAKA